MMGPFDPLHTVTGGLNSSPNEPKLSRGETNQGPGQQLMGDIVQKFNLEALIQSSS